MKYEHWKQPLLSSARFYRRLARNAAAAAAFVAFSLTLGMVGYRTFGDLDWLDAFLNASMILTGMGPVATMTTAAGKIFAGCYALYSGIAFLTAMGVLFAPLYHRFLHSFHMETEEDAKEDERAEERPSRRGRTGRGRGTGRK